MESLLGIPSKLNPGKNDSSSGCSNNPPFGISTFYRQIKFNKKIEMGLPV